MPVAGFVNWNVSSPKVMDAELQSISASRGTRKKLLGGCSSSVVVAFAWRYWSCVASWRDWGDRVFITSDTLKDTSCCGEEVLSCIGGGDGLRDWTLLSGVGVRWFCCNCVLWDAQGDRDRRSSEGDFSPRALLELLDSCGERDLFLPLSKAACNAVIRSFITSNKVAKRSRVFVFRSTWVSDCEIVVGWSPGILSDCWLSSDSRCSMSWASNWSCFCWFRWSESDCSELIPSLTATSACSCACSSASTGDLIIKRAMCEDEWLNAALYWCASRCQKSPPSRCLHLCADLMAVRRLCQTARALSADVPPAMSANSFRSSAQGLNRRLSLSQQ